VLILDEATSALDSESEREVRSAIERITERATTIIVAHRISTVMHADTIVVMDAGTIVDVGAHQALLNRCELYRRLCDLQFSADAPVPLNG
jgi:ABC-type multidrug transport system fused ATPase/permease subunit